MAKLKLIALPNRKSIKVTIEPQPIHRELSAS
ncbi:DUF2274 domain-containing protein [Bradyrhizobium sp. SZCCHNR3058]